MLETMAAETVGETAAAAGELSLSWPEALLCAAGLAVLGGWLLLYGGPRALRKSPVRRHCVPVWLPFLLLGVWFLALFPLGYAAELVFGRADAALAAAGRNLMTLALNAALIGGMLAAGNDLFARRLTGFGLHPRTLLKDIGWGAVNLAAVYPLVFGGVVLVVVIGRLLTGESYMIEAHESLAELLRFGQFWVRAAVIVQVVVVVPVMEELLFRGLMQSAIQSVLPGVWPGVMLTSALFAAVHSPTHVPAIFALSCGLGYAYERSGSLLRPIMMHALFNAVSVASVLLM